MTTSEHGSDVNLEELRCQLVSRIAVLLMVTSGLMIWLTLLQKPLPIVAFGLLILLIGLGWGVQALVNTRPTLARHLLVWGLTTGLLAAMGLFDNPWLPFLGLLLILVSAMLLSGNEFATAGVVAVAVMWLRHRGARVYPLPELLIALALSAALARLTVRTLYTALEWAWTMQQRADHLLHVARDRQGELNRTLKSLDLSNTTLRRTQRELVSARMQAEEAQRMKEQFAANVSHELRTPLNLILGFSQVMHLSPEVYGEMHWPHTLRRDVYQIHRSSRHLMEMINDVLDLSRFEMAGFTLNKDPTPLEMLLQDTVEMAESLFRDHSIRLEVEIAPDLPTLEIDRTRIRQVLLNLLKNAVNFTEEGTVRVEARRVGDEAVISVGDTGPGIPADKLPCIFDKFYRVDSSLRRRHGGAGLGLAISKNFVEAHGGRIWVESEENVGSVFYFALPIPGRYVPVSRLSVDRPFKPMSPGIPPSILVVDPDPTVADLVRRQVEEYRVVQVENPDQLAEEIMLHHPQAVVWNTPPGKPDNHYQIPPVPVPFIECSLPSQAWVVHDLAVAACLTKPITARQLLREIERLGDIHSVLVIDDDRGFCQLVERMLKTTGRPFEMRHAYGGRDGLRAMRAQRSDVVLLDLIMPGVDGFQVLEEMKREPKLADVPVVLLTATSYAEDALRQHGDQVVIRRQDGLRPAEVLRCLRAVIGVLKPRYDEHSAPKETLAARDV